MFGWGMGGGFLSVIGGMFVLLLWFVCFAVAVALIFLLVRFLLVGTRAAQLYVARHEPAKPAASAMGSAPAPAASAPAAPAPIVTPAAATPAKAPTKPTATKPAAAKSAPVKPATSVPRTPKSPKGAPKKP